MSEPFTLSLTSNAAADLACDLIDDFVRCHGGGLRSHDIFTLGEAHGMVRKVQALISAGWLSGLDADRWLNSEVSFATGLLHDIRSDYEGDNA